MAKIASLINTMVLLVLCGGVRASEMAESAIEVTVERTEIKTLNQTPISNLPHKRQMYVVTYRVENRSDRDIFSVIGEPYLIEDGHFIQHVTAFKKLKINVMRRWRTSSILRIKAGGSTTFSSAYPYFENFVTEFAFTSSLTKAEAQMLMAEGAGNDIWGQWARWDESGGDFQSISNFITRHEIVKRGRIKAPEHKPELPVSVRIIGDPYHEAEGRRELKVTYEFENHTSNPAWVLFCKPIEFQGIAVQSMRWPDGMGFRKFPKTKLRRIEPKSKKSIIQFYQHKHERPFIIEFAALANLNGKAQMHVERISTLSDFAENRAWLIKNSEAIYATVPEKKPDAE